MNNEGNTTERPRPYPSFRWLVNQLQQTVRNSVNETDDASRKNAKRIGLLADLIGQLDIIIYCQICILYYIDCSLWRFIFRCLPQFSLSNSRALLLFPSPIHRGYLASIVSTNMLFAVLHVFLDPPHGDELSRGYVHGLFLIDFVGEPSPASKWKMVMMDICIFAMQLLLLSAVMEKRELMLPSKDSSSVQTENGTLPDAIHQDVDAEERGVRRDQEVSEAQETQPEHPETQDPTGHVFDEFYTGQVNILTLNPTLTFRKAWMPPEHFARYIRTPH